jgi:hypothetical protein
MKPQDKFVITAGAGFWGLDRYPWGGCFHRAPQNKPLTGTIQEIRATYRDGSPSRIAVKLDLPYCGDSLIGVQL